MGSFAPINPCYKERTMRITLSLPDRLARRFLAAVPVRQRSALVARLLEAEFKKHERELERACRAANDDAALAADVEGWQACDDPKPRFAER